MKQVTPKKHLGQHFLKDENIARKIVNGLDPGKMSTLIEVGPGTGVLTKYLLDEFPDFIAFDVDTESVAYLKDHFPEHATKFLHQDFLKYNLAEMNGPIGVIGNFPYNISSQLFFKIWDHRDTVNEVVCMIQKEVADRIVSKEGNKTYGILSVLLQAFYDIEYLFTVPPQVFNPPPKVQSAVIRLTRNETARLECDEALFKRVVKAGFGKRRKTLRNALKDLNLDFATDTEVFGQRAEQLSVSEFIQLTKYISA
ncbi:16S rRNA (adenine(1518)-N(6)/adenine(1519)-N(6))-dimethyltransferase RsmA [Marinoscillum sp. 108]|uniref:16S rRNA (adenine(1518)-N(6)/adenine(1519)-N(6))- dimethyltransferase RsmA n=1 Tax=Marinoscillum sp. 108 TaxID=2653151 RepID=UPI0012F2673B|nr:16S rRNA (adenine(1518)-N(6)/adenine(1519)-N(6))-dimethyltransferase RsmA [Marinoscillum sp. 108]VXD16449.1 Ribosomal RNA small subunit methyltransferase A [Marinoscillum sp. 108]